MLLPEEYVKWNAHLLDYCMKHSVDESGHFTLAIHQMLDETDDPAAESQYKDAVRDAFASLLYVTRDPLLRLLSLSDEEKRPLCTAFLGIAVLASESMQANEYYEHLARFLSQRQEGSSVHGFVHRSFEQCWITLENWLQQQGYRMDRPDQDGSRYIRWPKMHALLRSVDVEKLPRFFREYKLSPLRRTPEERLSCFFSVWIATGQSGITSAGRYAWEDRLRQPNILRQIIRILDSWDETQQPATFRRASAVRRTRAKLVLDIYSGKPLLYIRARRPNEFANSLASGLPGRFWQCDASSETEWYDDIPLNNNDLEYLRSGFESPNGVQRVVFRGAPMFVFVISEYGSGFETQDDGELPLNAPCAVLCRTNVEKAVADYLDRISGRSPSICKVSVSWTLFHAVRPIFSDIAPPAHLDTLRVATSLTLQFEGGLNAGQPYTWLECSPPQRMLTSGHRQPDRVFINDTPHQLEDGCLRLDTALGAPGAYLIQVGPLTRRLVMEPVRVKNWEPPVEELASELEVSSLQPLPVDRLSGDWTLLGSVVGEIANAHDETHHFSAQWAIGRDECDKRAAVALVSNPALPSHNVGSFHTVSARRWAEAVLDAAQPRLGSVRAGTSRTDMQTSWNDYASMARRIRLESLRRKRVRQEAW